MQKKIQQTTYSSSAFATVSAFTIHKPLVVIIVIGDYKESPLPSIENASSDYYNVIRAFNYIRGYDVVFATNNDDYKHLTKKNRVTNINNIKSFNFKLKWLDEDMGAFNTHVAEEILLSQNSYDSLIYILSSHGDGDQSIYYSNGDQLPLAYIDDMFNNKNCKCLRQRPKIYMFDVNRHGSDSYTSSRSNQLQVQKKMQMKNDDIEIEQSLASTNNDNNSTVFITKTYTEKNHYCALFGNSKQQPSPNIVTKTSPSLFIESITKVVSSNVLFINSSLGDVLFETRQIMANKLSMDNNKVKLDEIVLNENSTMPYDIQFSSSAVMKQNFQEEKESQTNVCIIYSFLLPLLALSICSNYVYECKWLYCVCVFEHRVTLICMMMKKK